MAIEGFPVISWSIYDQSETVLGSLISLIGDEVYHRNYGDEVRLGWPENHAFSESQKSMGGHWWR